MHLRNPIINETMFVLLAALVVISCLVYYFIIRADRIQKCMKDIPGEKPLFLLGNSLDFVDFHAILNVYKTYFDKYGPIVKVQIGPRRMIFSSMEHTLFELVLSSPTMTEKTRDYKFLHNWLGTGLLTSGTSKWKKRRRAITPAFHFKILEQFVSTFETQTNIFVEKLESEIGNPSVDIYEYMTLLTLDIICESAMGISVNAQQQSNNKYVDCVREMGRITFRRVISPIRMYDTLYPLTPDYYKEQKIVKYLHYHTDCVIKQRKEILKNQPPIVIDDNQDFGTRPKIAFLDLLLQSTIDGKPLSTQDLREEVDTFMFEGHDTTASGASFATYMLSQNQDVQEKAFKEQLEVLNGDLNKPITYTDLTNMKYLELVIKEAFRLYPSVPIIGRTLSEDVQFGDLLLPRGLDIALLVFHMHRNEKYFKDPLKFIPERFEDPEFRKESNFVYVPFSAGPRNCIDNIIWSDEAKFTQNGIFNRHNSHYWNYTNPHVVRVRNFQGSWQFNVYCAVRNDAVVALHFYEGDLNGQKLAMFEMKSILSKLICKFRLLPTPPSEAPILSPETILKSLNGVRIRLERRST